jgi:hypothetical protein
MKTSNRWWIVLLVAVVGCGPMNYWVGGYADALSDMFPTIMPSTKRYVYPPGYDPSPPVPRSGQAPKKPGPEQPLQGADLDPADAASGAPAGGAAPSGGDAPGGAAPPTSSGAAATPAAAPSGP